MKVSLFKRGNEKIYSNTAITCLPTHVCRIQCAGCYAKRPEIRFPKTCLPAREKHLQAAKKETFAADMISQITADISSKKIVKLEYFRPHESGDFFSQEYVNSWVTIAKTFPAIQFYTYTKTNFDFAELEALPNFNLIRSITEDGGFNFGNSERIKQLETAGYKVCPCNKDWLKTNKCMRDCKQCAEYSKVCFPIH